MSMVWKLTYTLQDAKGAIAPYSIWLEPTAAFSGDQYDVADFAASLAEDLDNVINAAIIAMTLSISLSLPSGLKSAPAANSDVEEGAVSTYEVRNLPYTFSNRIPTYREDYLAAGNQPLFSNADVSQFFNMHVDPEDLPAAWGTGPTDSRGERLGDLRFLFENFKPRKRRRR